MKIAIEVRALQVIYDRKLVLDIPRLTVAQGETLAIVGPNGSGKSTLLRVLALLERPYGGEVYFDGDRVGFGARALPYRRRVALVLQQPLLRHVSVFENVATGLRFRRMAGDEVRRRVGQGLQRLGVAHLGKRKAGTLSGGEAQRVSLARALVLEPELLLLDEPFAALDSPTTLALMEDLQQALAAAQATTIFVTHDRNEALMLGDRIAVMMGGRLLQIDVPERVFGAPESEEVAAFMGVENVLPGRVSQQEQGLATVMVQDKAIEVVGEHKAGEELLVCLRPEDIALQPLRGPVPSTSARNRLVGRVVRWVPMGSQVRVVVDCGFPLVSLVTRQSFSDLSLAEGSPVLATFKASAAHIIKRRSS